jgi:hypothetical protein
MNRDMRFQQIYPERRIVTGREIIGWARDLMIDAAIEKESLRHERETGERLSDEAIDRIAKDTPIPDIRQALEVLEDSGKATFSRERIQS